MFVPAAKRGWGYYVYPLLEGVRFAGRIQVKDDRAKSELNLLVFWPEPGVKWAAARWKNLDAELARFAHLAEVQNVPWACTRPAMTSYPVILRQKECSSQTHRG